MKKRFAFTIKLVSILATIFILPSCENFFSGASARQDSQSPLIQSPRKTKSTDILPVLTMAMVKKSTGRFTKTYR